MQNPIESRTRPDHILLEQFLKKGYQCEEVQEEDGTVFILTCQKKNTEAIAITISEAYKEIIKVN